jgi:hypothetical protein
LIWGRHQSKGKGPMTTEERVELAAFRTKSRLLGEFPQDMCVLRMLEVFIEEMRSVGKSKSEER